MRLLKHISVTRFLVCLVFLLGPTFLVAMFLLWNGNHYFTVLREQWFTQSLYMAAGLFTGFLLAQFRLRFLPLFSLLLLLWYATYTILDRFAIGEFDSFFLSVQFLVFAWLFTAGWLCGWAIQRVSFFPFLLSGGFLLLSIFLIAKTGNLVSAGILIRYLAPVILYAVYMVYTNEALKQLDVIRKYDWWRFARRLVLFLSLMSILLGAVLYLLYPEIVQRVEEFGGGAKEGENQMLQQKNDGTVENRQSMGMGSSNNRNKNPEPLFCAHIDHFLPGSDIPNPLYLESYHFTKFDTLTETFERDTLNRFNDEFQPDVSQIPLFSTVKDSSRILNAFGTKHRETVNIEVYKKRLSASAFLAPGTAFWVQPITVEKEFQHEFSSAYRSKSYVSELNSAYFIYNTDNPQIKAFQEQRFHELRKAKGYEQVNQDFMRYYTFFPSAPQYRRIRVLADSLAKGKTTVIDKVLGIRDFFLQRNELGEKVYSYTDNPGVPGLPGSSKLIHFLFEGKKGYCAYYAGATLFMLRAMGIPSRIVTGFLTVDRSDKNAGWYWFYEDQSHGWVQVYFPEYGWIDFDTTVGNDEARQSPKPDGTPPMQPPKHVLAAAGRLLSVDTLHKLIDIQAYNLLFKDQEYSKIDMRLTLDLEHTNIWKDSLPVRINQLQQGQQVMAISYVEKLSVFSPERQADALVRKLPAPLPIDEVYIRSPRIKNKPETSDQQPADRPFRAYLVMAVLVLLALLLVAFSLPGLVYRWYKWNSGHAKGDHRKAYYAYRAATFLLNQLGIERSGLTPWQFARETVDPLFGTHFAAFMSTYLKMKYGNMAISPAEQRQLRLFYPEFEPRVFAKFPWHKRLVRFLNLNTFIQYYYIPQAENQESI